MRNPPEMTVYDSLSGEEIQSLPAPETMVECITMQSSSAST
jgi:hypothetical protein